MFWTLFACDMLVPIIMLIAGRVMWKHPPKDINGTTGYRTSRSMKNMDTWIFAHEHCGRTWWKTGWIMLAISAAVHIPYYNDPDKTIEILSVVVCILQCAVLISSIFPTENALKKTFDEEGNRIV